MKTEKRLQFRVVSTENHKALFTSRKKAKVYIRQLRKEGQVGVYTEFRIYKIGRE